MAQVPILLTALWLAARGIMGKGGKDKGSRSSIAPKVTVIKPVAGRNTVPARSPPWIKPGFGGGGPRVSSKGGSKSSRPVQRIMPISRSRADSRSSFSSSKGRFSSSKGGSSKGGKSKGKGKGKKG